MRWFSKQSEDKLKEMAPELLNASIPLSLTLQSFRMTYYRSQTEPYSATIEYIEYPDKSYSEKGAEKSISIKAKTWDELVDKVSIHFKEA